MAPVTERMKGLTRNELNHAIFTYERRFGQDFSKVRIPFWWRCSPFNERELPKLPKGEEWEFVGRGGGFRLLCGESVDRVQGYRCEACESFSTAGDTVVNHMLTCPAMESYRRTLTCSLLGIEPGTFADETIDALAERLIEDHWKAA